MSGLSQALWVLLLGSLLGLELIGKVPPPCTRR
jgi:H+-translocating NAD(P) transhydrogenase subunit alpha